MSADVAGIACAAKKCPNGRKLICLYANQETFSARKRRSVEFAVGKESHEGVTHSEQSFANSETKDIPFQLEGWIA